MRTAPVDLVALADAERADAARTLSAYTPGRMPVERPVLEALATLEVYGEPQDVALLRDVLSHESDLLGRLARGAIGTIRERQRRAQRQAFADALQAGSGAQLQAEATWRARGLGPTEAWCAAYADRVLGDQALPLTARSDADPVRLLARGEARAAVAALAPDVPAETTIRAFEDAGEVQAALQIHARLAAAGDPTSEQALQDYGIEVERLMLGLLHRDRVHEPETLETLVRRGKGLTVRVLAERVVDPPSASDQATAADALGRMLRTEARPDPLPRAERERIRAALLAASYRATPAVRPIVREALTGEEGI